MKMTRFTKILSLILCLVIVAAIAIFATGCSGKKTDVTPNDAVTTTAPVSEEVTKIGEGQKTISFIVKDSDRKETTFEIKSDKATVGEALTDAGLISGSVSEFGLMVDTVMGIRADYNLDKAYWAFYIGGEYAQTGVDSTDLVDGETYMFEYTPA